MDAQARGREKRRHDRIKIGSCKSLWNLSVGGAYIITDKPKRLGSKFYFELKLGQSGNVFKAMAKVIRVLHKPNPKIGEPAGMAVVFINVAEEDRALLRDFLEHNKMSGPDCGG